jgi:hypothetical protein
LPAARSHNQQKQHDLLQIMNKTPVKDNSDLAPFSISGFQRREAPPKPTFTVRALRAQTVNAKGARSEITACLIIAQYFP